MVAALKRIRSAYNAFLNPDPRVQAKQEPRPVRAAMNDTELAIAARSVIEASFDSVARTRENARHWQWADNLSADASLRPDVRIALRSQSRYELHENNSIGRGLVETLVTDTIGDCGPRLQVIQFSKKINREIEKAWHRWCNATGFIEKLETNQTACITDGEALIRFINNVTIEDPVTLDIQLIECDHLRSPQFELEVSDVYVDGVHLDRFGNPYAYDLLRHHPGADYWHGVDQFSYDTYSHTQVIHTFKQIRPGQHRGVPEFAPALPLFAFLRRFTLATVSAAETAASVSQVVESDSPIPEELEEEYAAATFEKFLDTIPIDRNSATVLPNMWKLKQFAAEHPTTTYKMFKRELINEIARCVLVPTNIAMADSQDSNMSSARFDWLGYERKVRKRQAAIARRILDRVFGEWLIEAALVGAIPATAANYILRQFQRWGPRGISNNVEHSWSWNNLRDADQKDAADSQRVKLQNGTTHRAKEYSQEGLDIEIEDQRAAETFGCTVEEYRRAVMASIFTNGNLLMPEDLPGRTASQDQQQQPQPGQRNAEQKTTQSEPTQTA